VAFLRPTPGLRPRAIVGQPSQVARASSIESAVRTAITPQPMS
jgi:hypothetical protein